MEDGSEGGWRGRSGHHSVLTKDACVLNEAIDTHGINSGGSSNDNMASDFSTPQSHAMIDDILESSLRVIRVCAFL